MAVRHYPSIYFCCNYFSISYYSSTGFMLAILIASLFSITAPLVYWCPVICPSIFYCSYIGVLISRHPIIHILLQLHWSTGVQSPIHLFSSQLHCPTHVSHPLICFLLQLHWSTGVQSSRPFLYFLLQLHWVTCVQSFTLLFSITVTLVYWCPVSTNQGGLLVSIRYLPIYVQHLSNWPTSLNSLVTYLCSV